MPIISVFSAALACIIDINNIVVKNIIILIDTIPALNSVNPEQ